MARPKKKLSEKKAIQVNVRFNLKDYLDINSAANRVGLTKVEFIRRSSLNKRLPKTNLHPVNRRLLIDLSRYGNNLNQIAKKIHQNKPQNDFLFRQLQEVKDLFNAIKISLINDSQTN